MGQLSLTTPRIEASGSNVWKTAVNELLSNETQSTTNGTLNSRDTSRRKSSPLIHVQVAFVSFTSVAGQRAKGTGEQFPRRCSCGAPRRRIAPVSAVRYYEWKSRGAATLLTSHLIQAFGLLNLWSLPTFLLHCFFGWSFFSLTHGKLNFRLSICCWPLLEI